MSDLKDKIPQYWAKALEQNLRPNLYFMDNTHWYLSPKERVKANWKSYDPWFRDFLKTAFGRKLEIPDWTLGKIATGQVGSIFGVKVLSTNATKIHIPKAK